MAAPKQKKSTGLKLQEVAARTAAAVFHPGSNELSGMVHYEKAVQESVMKYAVAKSAAVVSMEKWADQETNVIIKEMYLKLAKVEAMQVRLHTDFAAQYDSYRRYYKYIIDGEESISKMRRQMDTIAARTHKTKKQLDAAEAKKNPYPNQMKESDLKEKKKLEALDIEHAKALSNEESARSELRRKEHNHDIFKYKKILETMRFFVKAHRTLHEKCLQICETEEKILEQFSIQPGSVNTRTLLTTAVKEGSKQVNNLANSLDLPPPLSHGEAYRRPGAVPGEQGGHGDTYDALYIPIPEQDNPSDTDPATGCSRMSQDCKPVWSPGTAPSTPVTLLGEPGGHSETYDATYIPIPEEDVHDQPRGSLSRDSRSARKSRDGRPLPPVPIAGESHGTENGRRKSQPDTPPVIPPRKPLPPTPDETQMTGQMYLDLLTGSSTKSKGKPNYSLERETSRADDEGEYEEYGQSSLTRGPSSSSKSSKSSDMDEGEAFYTIVDEDNPDLHMSYNDILQTRMAPRKS